MDAPTPNAPTAIDELLQFIVAVLPDSITQRRRLLSALLQVLPESYQPRYHVVDMLRMIEQHEKLQRELPLNLNS